MSRYLVRWSACGILGVFFLAIFTVGCSKGKRAADHIDVTGTVSYKGKPVTGGRLAFVNDDGFAAPGFIDEQGNYQVKAPAGHNKITVDTSMLDKSNRGLKVAVKGAGRPGQDPEQVVGTYVRIPLKYKNPETSDLEATVSKEQTKFDLTLKD